jgi:hypothetical protein
MFFKKRVELSAVAAGKASLALVIVAKFLQGKDDTAAMMLLVVAGQLLPGKTVKVGKDSPSQAGLSAGLEALIELTGKAT